MQGYKNPGLLLRINRARLPLPDDRTLSQAGYIAALGELSMPPSEFLGPLSTAADPILSQSMSSMRRDQSILLILGLNKARRLILHWRLGLEPAAI